MAQRSVIESETEHNNGKGVKDLWNGSHEVANRFNAASLIDGPASSTVQSKSFAVINRGAASLWPRRSQTSTPASNDPGIVVHDSLAQRGQCQAA